MKVIGGVIGVLFLALVLVGVSSYFSYSSTGVDYEEGIDAQVRQNQNKYSEFTQTAIESMGVAKQYQAAVKDVITAGIEGRFGKDGSKSLVQAFNEAYPANFDPALFNKVQMVIESGRRDFSAEQKQLISKVQGYRSSLRKPWSGMWLKYAGYPTINLDDPKYNPVVSAATTETYKTGTDKGIQFQ